MVPADIRIEAETLQQALIKAREAHRDMHGTDIPVELNIVD